MKEKEDEKEKEKMKTKFKLTIQGQDYFADTDYTKHQPMGSPVTTPKGTHKEYVYWDKDKNLTLDESLCLFRSIAKDESSISELQTTTGVSTTSSSSSSTLSPVKEGILESSDSDTTLTGESATEDAA